MQREERLKPYRPDTNIWILVSDPDQYSYDKLEFDTNTSWSGVSDYASLKHMRDMDQGDLVLFCHSGTEQAIVGLARVTSDPYPAPEQNDPTQLAVDIEPVERLESPVRLAELEDDPRFQDFDLLSAPELCIAPVPSWMWDMIQEKSHAHLAGITQDEDLP
jgi:predicted RNA-binding protein with PUA-like domain